MTSDRNRAVGIVLLIVYVLLIILLAIPYYFSREVSQMDGYIAGHIIPLWASLSYSIVFFALFFSFCDSIDFVVAIILPIYLVLITWPILVLFYKPHLRRKPAFIIVSLFHFFLFVSVGIWCFVGSFV